MALWRNREPLVLASKSTARLALLAAAGIAVEVLPADIDERSVEARASAQDASAAAALLARERPARWPQKPGRLVLGADQTLALGRAEISPSLSVATALSNSWVHCAARPMRCMPRSR